MQYRTNPKLCYKIKKKYVWIWSQMILNFLLKLENDFRKLQCFFYLIWNKFQTVTFILKICEKGQGWDSPSSAITVFSRCSVEASNSRQSLLRLFHWTVVIVYWNWHLNPISNNIKVKYNYEEPNLTITSKILGNL